MTEEDVVKQRRKRKREKELELSPVQSEGIDKLLCEVEKLCNEAKAMLVLAEKNVNTKVEIKEKARYMGKLAKRELSAKGRVAFRAPTAPFDFAMEPKTPSIPKGGEGPSKDLHTELLYCARCKDEVNKEKRIMEEIKLEIEETKAGKNMDKLPLLIKKVWPEGVFERTELKTGRITSEPLSNTKLVILSAEEMGKEETEESLHWVEKLTGQGG